MVQPTLDINPTIKGIYVVYIDPKLDIPFAAKELMIWDGTRWGHRGSDTNFRGHVYGWIGPLSALHLTSDKKEENEETINDPT